MYMHNIYIYIYVYIHTYIQIKCTIVLGMYMYVCMYMYVYIYIYILGSHVFLSSTLAVPVSYAQAQVSGKQSDPSPNKHSLTRKQCRRCRMEPPTCRWFLPC